MLVEKKLRDVTKEEFEEWNNRNCFGRKCDTCIFRNVNCSAYEDDAWVNNKDIYSDKFLDRIIEVKVDAVLDEVENEYLTNIIKPFKKQVVEIVKFRDLYIRKDHIVIYYLDEIGTQKRITLPDFTCESMYKSMEPDKPYKLKELGL